MGAHEAGLTLVEMLIVLAMIGVMAGAVVLAVGRSGGGGAQAEARRLATRLALAADETMVTDTPLAIDWDARGYRFLGWNGTAWVASRTPALEPHKLPAGLSLDAAGAHPLLIGGDGGGATLDAHLKARDEAWRVRFDGVNATAEPDAAT
ncbi:prepilin-type N-terminal cleavage/methylation domain-containing protein [Sphingomonas sp. BIUV-7]|uniref:Prepilin-type N-terminal cleavage/methylation domain-containing protein n=1 Tax=Sphingomonas natans TaxID=3063330 RepID=A0ABT8Y5K6_9SPHN|nr:prepilin-type N-terminal cleavage/methylation domain-containing protein [Sphingomonas sp. BIUV-7]MDO6413611.1 prepilin-type N-terminal cleavage/methylation domain-containing protein [Sphingomonas sp. BIUV-7]